MTRELVIYCDESDSSGKHFANFYGGALVESKHLAEVIARLEAVKTAQNLFGELKWQKITEQYSVKYLAFLDEAFDLVSEGKLKFRVMFTQNYFSAYRLTTLQRENGFFLLYYQFIKHAGVDDTSTGVRIYLNKPPDTAEKCAAFKSYGSGLNSSADFRRARIVLRPDQIAEVDSKQHVVLQALDVVLGAILPAERQASGKARRRAQAG